MWNDQFVDGRFNIQKLFKLWGSTTCLLFPHNFQRRRGYIWTLNCLWLEVVCLIFKDFTTTASTTLHLVGASTTWTPFKTLRQCFSQREPWKALARMPTSIRGKPQCQHPWPSRYHYPLSQQYSWWENVSLLNLLHELVELMFSYSLGC